MEYSWTFVDYHHASGRGLNDTLDIIRRRITETRKSMQSLRMKLANRPEMDLQLLDEWQIMNERLRKLKIFEAEFTYSKNMM